MSARQIQTKAPKTQNTPIPRFQIYSQKQGPHEGHISITITVNTFMAYVDSFTSIKSRATAWNQKPLNSNSPILSLTK